MRLRERSSTGHILRTDVEVADGAPISCHNSRLSVTNGSGRALAMGSGWASLKGNLIDGAHVDIAPAEGIDAWVEMSKNEFRGSGKTLFATYNGTGAAHLTLLGTSNRFQGFPDVNFAGGGTVQGDVAAPPGEPEGTTSITSDVLRLDYGGAFQRVTTSSDVKEIYIETGNETATEAFAGPFWLLADSVSFTLKEDANGNIRTPDGADVVVADKELCGIVRVSATGDWHVIPPRG